MADFRHETQRLILRDWREDDWSQFWDLTNTPAVMEWLGGVLDDAGCAEGRERIEAYHRKHGHTFWVVERKDDGGEFADEMLGFCGLKCATVEGEKVFGMPEIGWRLRQDAWGRGYAKEAAIASLELGFGQFAAQEIVALTVEENTGSWGLMKRLGMKRRSDLDHVIKWQDTLYNIITYAIGADDWRHKNQDIANG